MANDTFNEVLTSAVNDLSEHGYDDPLRVLKWTELLRVAAAKSSRTASYLDHAMRQALGSIYRRLVEQGSVINRHPGVSRFTLERIKPQLRSTLDRRIFASAQLIVLNREEAIETMLRRFAGWCTSLPSDGSDTVDKVVVKKNIAKPIQSLPFTERRVMIDQGHKLVAAINETVAEGNNAIALVWHSHWREVNYDYRPDHKERDQKIYLIRKSWAHDAGLIKIGAAGYYDQLTAVAEEPFCRCYATYIYHLRQLPPEMLTQKGRDELKRVRIA